MTHDLTLLRALVMNYPTLKSEQAEVLAVAEGSQEDAASLDREFSPPFPILIDRDGSAHHLAGSEATHPALYIVDRFGEVFGAFRAIDGSRIPTVDEIIEEVRFINIQCDECGHPEWPVV